MSEINVSGSCLCGSISYTTTGQSNKFWHCHCSRCRKATGTGHASNILMKPESFEWTTGEDLLKRFKVPDAKFFYTVFCSVCGSPMPGVAPDSSFALIPAGSIDGDPGISPNGRIYQDSRVAWSCATEELPLFETYPGS
jgi:hypothetical protein